jgi:hypothetical protein
MHKVNPRYLLFLLLFSLMILCPREEFAQSAAAAVTPTEISADQGPCSALITVTGVDGKPVYNAKVTARVRSGFMCAKKLDLETYTSAAGQVKIVGLPEAPKKDVLIFVSKDDKMESVVFNRDGKCHVNFDVQLK